MSGRRVARWRETPVGGVSVRMACAVRTTDADAAALASGIVSALEGTGFTAEAGPSGATVLRRGSRVADTLLTGSGLAAVTKRLGPLSLHAIVVVQSGPHPEGGTAVTAAMVAGDALAPEIADAVDAAIDRAAEAGADIDGAGWMRSVDLPESSLGHPRTAADAGIR